MQKHKKNPPCSGLEAKMEVKWRPNPKFQIMCEIYPHGNPHTKNQVSTYKMTLYLTDYENVAERLPPL